MPQLEGSTSQSEHFSALAQRSAQVRRLAAVERRIEQINGSVSPPTPEQVERLERLVALSRAACGLPPRVHDLVALDRVARQLSGGAAA